ncbi:MAG: phosphate ABC transporter permease PstA [Candidatus Omnitrophica bacterium]|nr:phosphate ABC transporter permease PstA [Candidatus Omnitrophota bacterium]
MDKKNNIHVRRLEENIFKSLMVFSTGAIVLALALILWTVIRKGLPHLSLGMLTQAPKSGYYLGKDGGILNAILGSLYLTGGAALLAILVSLPVVLYLNVYLKKGSPLAYIARFSFDILWGIPSIVYGAFGFTIMLLFGVKSSLLGGMIAVTFLIFPIMSRSMDEVVRMVPGELMDASYALGATKLETAFKVVVRQALPGISTAVLISFGRGIGDAASLIFTAGFTDSLPTSLLAPAATLPLAIFFQFGTPMPEVQGRAYASALTLTLIILVISVAARLLTRKFTKHVV